MDFLVAALAQNGFVLSFALAALVWLRLPRRPKLGLLITGIIGGLLCLAFIKIGGALYYDPRPFVTEHVTPLFPHSVDNGFPSDHTVLTMFVGLCVLLYSRRWGTVLVVLSLASGVARVVAGVHSPIDIIGAVVMAAVAAACGHVAARWALSRWVDPVPTPGSS